MNKTNNKTLDYYLSLPYRLEIVPDTEEGGYGARYPELPGCITCSDTMEGIIANAEDAKKAWLEAALEEGIEIAEPENDTDLAEYSGQFKLRLPKSLHRSLSVHAKEEGISMNQYCLYLLSKNDAAHDPKPFAS
jgi:predicted RNase H-like HicB family nuclease